MTKIRDQFLPYNRPDMTEAEVSAVADVVRSLWITRGPRVSQFEVALAQYLGTSHVVALNSCTAGLHLALVAAGLGPGDEVITSPLTFAASVNVIEHVGATPVLADIDPRTGCLDPQQAVTAMTSRTRAILPVDYAGHPVDLDAFDALARDHDLTLVEDAAHAIASTYHGEKIGRRAQFTAFSFYATKNLATGEGGALVCPDQASEDRVRMLSLHGLSQNAWARYSQKGSWYYEIEAPGFKYNMTDMQAALGLVQLNRLDDMQARRRAIAHAYHQAFSAHPALEVPFVASHVEMAWHIYPLRIRPERLTISRDQFILALHALNIGTSVHFIPIHYHPYYRDRYGWVRGQFPMAEEYFSREISLPLYPTMSEADVCDVQDAVLDVAERYKA